MNVACIGFRAAAAHECGCGAQAAPRRHEEHEGKATRESIIGQPHRRWSGNVQHGRRGGPGANCGPFTCPERRRLLARSVVTSWLFFRVPRGPRGAGSRSFRRVRTRMSAVCHGWRNACLPFAPPTLSLTFRASAQDDACGSPDPADGAGHPHFGCSDTASLAK